MPPDLRSRGHKNLHTNYKESYPVQYIVIYSFHVQVTITLCSNARLNAFEKSKQYLYTIVLSCLEPAVNFLKQR